MQYRVDNLTYDRLSVSNLVLIPGKPRWVNELDDPLIEAYNKQLILITPAPGSSVPGGTQNVYIVGQSAPISITAAMPLTISNDPVDASTQYMDVGNSVIQILTANPNRKSLLIQNLAFTRSVWIAYTSGECVSNQCILIPPRYYREFPNGVPGDSVYAVSEVTGTGAPESNARVSIEEGV